MAALKDVLWDEGKGAWFDYDLENDKKKLEFYPSNFAPLWAGCFSDSDDVDKALKYLEVRRQHGGLLHRGRTTCLLPDLWQVAATHPGSTQCLTSRSHFGHQGAAVSQEEKAQEGSPGFRRAQPLGFLSSPHPQPR